MSLVRRPSPRRRLCGLAFTRFLKKHVSGDRVPASVPRSPASGYGCTARAKQSSCCSPALPRASDSGARHMTCSVNTRTLWQLTRSDSVPRSTIRRFRSPVDAGLHVDAVLAVLRTLDLHAQPVVFVGHSMGASLALRAGARHAPTRAVVAFDAPLYRSADEANDRIRHMG